MFQIFPTFKIYAKEIVFDEKKYKNSLCSRNQTTNVTLSFYTLISKGDDLRANLQPSELAQPGSWVSEGQSTPWRQETLFMSRFHLNPDHCEGNVIYQLG